MNLEELKSEINSKCMGSFTDASNLLKDADPYTAFRVGRDFKNTIRGIKSDGVIDYADISELEISDDLKFQFAYYLGKGDAYEDVLSMLIDEGIIDDSDNND